jgi:shikimate dehydrogenase
VKRRFILIGHPVGHSISPVIHAAAYAALGLEGHAYEAVDCPDEPAVAVQFARLVAGEVSGANVTVPHKRLAHALAHDAAPSAAAIGAANVLAPVTSGAGIRVVAHNTDVSALAEEIERLKPGIRRAAVLGSGGAALAAVAACQRLGAEQILVVARAFRSDAAPASWPAAESFRRLGAEPIAWSNAPGSAWRKRAPTCEVVLQATSAGMLGGGPGEAVRDVVPWEELGPGTLAYDLVYNPPTTPFLEAARRRGLLSSGGLGMLVGQAAHALELWLGVPAPRGTMQEAASQALFGTVRE